MKTLIVSSLVMVSSLSWSRPQDPNHESLKSLLQEVRDPYFSSQRRLSYLELTRANMQKNLAKENKVTIPLLNSKFKDPQMMDQMWKNPWIDLQTEFYTTLHQEMFHQKWNQRLQKKKVSDYGKNIVSAMQTHIGRYFPLKENQQYNRWVTISQTKNKQVTKYRVPQFLISQNMDQLVKSNIDVDFKDILAKESQESVGNPSHATFMKHLSHRSEWDKQTLAEKIVLNHRMYLRSISNGAKTIASIHFLSGDFTLPQTEAKVTNFVGSFCESCSNKQKKDFIASAMAYTKRTQKEFIQSYTPKTIVTTFCQSLKDNGYEFDAPKKPEVFNPRAPIVAVRDNVRVDQSQIMSQLLMRKYAAMRKTIEEHDMGVLFLTRELSGLTVQNLAAGTNLTCKTQNIAADIQVVKRSITEARSSVEKYISTLNEKMRQSGFNEDAIDETTEYFAQTNVSASIEAVLSFPQGMDHLINGVLRVDGDQRRRKNIDTAVSWGGTIVGVALTLTGIGAPEGVTILLTTAALVKGVSWGSYYFYRSQQEKSFHRQLMVAKKGLGKNFYLDQNMTTHFTDYQELKIKAITEFGTSAINYAKLHKLALVAAVGDVGRAHNILNKTMAQATAITEDVALDKVLEHVVSNLPR